MKNLKNSFGKLKVSESQKTKLVQDLFTNITTKYDLMNNFMSFGAHHLWKKKLIDLIYIKSNDSILDVGSGTGDIVNLLNKNYANINITSVDLNLSMLEKGKQKIKYNENKIRWINCNAESLPFKDDIFDHYIISFCLRNITLIEKALEEALRVLKPGGCFYCLEFSKPRSKPIDNIYKLYKSQIIPLMGKYIAKNENAYKYLEESISNFPDQKTLSLKLNELGFDNTSITNLFNGIVSIHKSFKIS